MGIGVLDAAAGDHGIALGKSGDDAVIGVALLAVIVDDAGALEAGSFGCVGAVIAHDIGDGGVDALFGELAARIHPDFKVVKAVARRGMNETGTSIIGDVFAIEQRDFELVAATETAQGVEAGGDVAWVDIADAD